VQGEIILGIEGEYIVNSKEFYSVFITEPNFKVIHSGRKIGDIPFSPQVRIDENILLAARIWKIKDIDFKSGKIEVIPANDGKKPMFSGSGGNIHQKIREEMLRIIKTKESYDELNEASNAILQKFRNDFKGFKINNYEFDRPLIIKDGKIIIYTFTGTKINTSLSYLIMLTGTEVSLNDHSSTFELKIGIASLKSLINSINEVYSNINNYLLTAIEANESLLGFSKWGKYLPMKYKCEILKERYFDFESAISFINNLNLIEKN
jgi:ATP-dependent Lhr-like helicase